MATLITKNSSTASSVPTNAQLVQGELAVNVTDKRLYTENASGTVVELGTNPGSAVTHTAGTAGAPAITTTGDTNTGIFFPAADTIAFSEGGVEALQLNSSGQIAASTDGTASVPVFTRSTDTNTGLFFPAADTVAASVGGAEGLRLTSTGLGVGTTSPTAKLDVSGTAAVSGAFAVAGNNISAVNSMGFRNRIINGDMRIDQRNAGASVTQTTANLYGIDRWQAVGSVTSKFTFQQSTTAPTGFINSTVITSSAATSVGSSDYYLLQQLVEGLNMTDLAWGTASAQSVTLSFWVRSSLTGTFGGAISNDGNNRSYPFTYTINVANTWEQKTVTIAGDTTGTWLTTSGCGMKVRFSMGVGSTYAGTAGAWAASDFRGATGCVNVVGTSGATWFVTGVQLEAGSVATPFERRDYGRELMMCQRYLPVFSSDNAGTGIWGYWDSSDEFKGAFNFLVPARVAPTGIVATASQWNCNNSTVGNPTANSIVFNGACETQCGVYWTVASGGSSNGKAGRAYPIGSPSRILFTGCEL